MRQTFILACFAVLFLTGCNEITGDGKIIETERQVSDFKELISTGSIDIVLQPGAPLSVKIISDENIVPYIETEVTSGTLDIHYKKGINIGKTSTQVIVSFPSLNKITTSGSGDITCKGMISNTQMLEVKSSGSGDTQLGVDAPALKVSGSGSGNFSLNGQVKDLKIELAGSGDADAKNLKSEDAEVRTTGSGDIKVFASNSLKAMSFGSGDILYWGNPTLPDTKVSGSGSVRAGQ